MKLIAYMRCSGLSQDAGDTWDRQRIAIEEYASLGGFEIVSWIKEIGVSGKTELDNRPGLTQAFTEMSKGTADGVIVEKLDRLARDLLISENIIADIKKKNYTLISVAEPDLCSNDPSRVLLRQIIASIAQYDRAMIVQKLRGAKQRKKVHDPNFREGRKPYGMHEGESETLAKMIKARTNGYAYHAIADSLNASGIKSRSGVKWTAMVVKRIVDRHA